jgi:hypothetical protein
VVKSRDALLVPLLGRTLRVTGEVFVRSEVLLLAVDAEQNGQMLTFRVDSAAEVTTMPAAAAHQRNIPIPQQPTPGLALTTATGGQSSQPVRAGALKVRFFGMEEAEFWFPCYFVGDPDAEVDDETGSLPRSLLGLTGVVNRVTLSFDGEPAVDAPPRARHHREEMRRHLAASNFGDFREAVEEAFTAPSAAPLLR